MTLVSKLLAPASKARFAPLPVMGVIALLLASSALSGPANAWSLFGDDAKSDAPPSAKAAAAPAENLDASIRQAQLLRIAGDYPEAIHHLSQLMIVASDDARVISEYGKTLAAMGRAQEAINFLTRAQQLQPGDWTIYSAMGVAYDQLGNQREAQASYERALLLKPGEASVLSNYALSRMLAKDPAGARKLIARAESAGGTSDPVIARNIAMIKDFAPGASVPAETFNKPAPAPHIIVPAGMTIAPPMTQTQTLALRQPQAQPKPVIPVGVVMQRVPVDPLAGPVTPAPAPQKIASRAPRMLMPKPIVAAKNTAPAPQVQTDAAVKPVAVKAAAANTMPTVLANKPASAKFQPAPGPTAVKTATAAKPAKDGVPALRLSASAF